MEEPALLLFTSGTTGRPKAAVLPARQLFWNALNTQLAVRDLFQHNRLARGRLTVRGERVDLTRIRCPLFVLAGARDHITPPPQVLALPALAPHAPARTWTVDAGHVGVFMGRRALTSVWPEVVAGFAAA
jgi:poly(3-hydroxyalkanoate) synthetase